MDGLLLCVLALTGCIAPSRSIKVFVPAAAAEVPFTLAATADGARYADFIGPDTPDGLIQLQLLQAGSNAPVIGALVEVGEPPNRPVSGTNGYGLFVLPVDRRFLLENAALLVLAPSELGSTRVVRVPFAPAPALVGGERGLVEAELESENVIPYPSKARRAGIQGTVRLSIVIDDEGRVANAIVESGPGFGLNEAAQDAIFGATFKPGSQDGKAVWSALVYKYNFLLQ